MDWDITLDGEHIYWVNGKPMPSVTTILNDIIPPDFDYPPESAIRGKRVHLATQYLDADELDFDSLDPLLVPYVEAWQRFKHDTGIKVRVIEKIVFNPTLGYCGTIDRICTMPKWGNMETIIDIKSGVKTIRDPLQTIGYSLCFKNVMGRGSVYLSEKGKYRFVRHENYAEDREIFIGAVNVFKFKYKGGKVWKK